MTIPSLDLQGSYYQISLNFYPNPTDPLSLYWVIDLNSVGTIQSPGNDYATIDSDLQIKIPKIEFEGNYYQIILNKYFNLTDPFGLYWVLDLSSVAPL